MGKNKKQKAHSEGQRYSGIEQHKREGKTLVPPLMTLPMRFSSWIDDRLPEMLWSALLITGLERDMALGIFRQVAKIVEGLHSAESRVDVTHSGFVRLPANTFQGILDLLSSSPAIAHALQPLLLLNDLPGKDVWHKALALQPDTADWETLKLAVGHTLGHQSQEATDCRWARVLAKIIAGQLHLPEELAKEIVFYPTYGDLKKVRPSIRAAEGSFAGMDDPASPWSVLFWEQCRQDTPCEPHPWRAVSGPLVTVGTTADRVRQVRAGLADHYCATTKTTAVDAAHEGAFGIAGYALAVVEEVLYLGNSTSILGRTGIRTLLECFVTLAYLVRSADASVWKSYRNYGSGQAKLAFLKLDQDGVTVPGLVSMETLEDLANEDRWQEFTKIDLGHWAGTDLRKMSEEVGLKGEYDRFYAWTSSFVHGNWAAVRDSVFDLCLNPLHRLHRALRATTAAQNDVVGDACYLADRILDLIDEAYPGLKQRLTVQPVM